MKNECPLQCRDNRYNHYFCQYDRGVKCEIHDYDVCPRYEQWIEDLRLIEFEKLEVLVGV